MKIHIEGQMQSLRQMKSNTFSHSPETSTKCQSTQPGAISQANEFQYIFS